MVWTGNYDPNGKVTPTTSITMNLRLPGQHADATGMNYNGFRNYNPDSAKAGGRYIESDPIGLAGGINTYVYAGSNPYKYIDPTGQFFWLIPVLEGGAEAAGWIGSAGRVIGIGRTIGSLWNSLPSMPFVADPVARSEYWAYKKICDEPPPPGLDKCEEAKWKLNRNKQCKVMRQDWDDKWLPGRHTNDIMNLERSIQNLEAWIAKNCNCNDK